MNHVADLIIIGALLYFLVRGFCQGFLRSILGPAALVIACGGAYVYYYQTGKLINSLIISIVGPFVLNIVFTLLLGVWRKAINAKDTMGLPSRLSGSCFSLLWSGTLLVLTLALILVLPGNVGWFQKIQHHILSSKSYTVLNKLSGDRLSVNSSNINKISDIFQNPKRLRKIRSTKEFKQIMADEKIKELLDNEEIVEQIQNRNIGKLLTNTQMQAILQDELLLRKFLALNKEILNAEEMEEEPQNN